MRVKDLCEFLSIPYQSLTNTLMKSGLLANQITCSKEYVQQTIATHIEIQCTQILPCVEKFQGQIIPVFIVRRNHRLDSTWLMPCITFT